MVKVAFPYHVRVMVPCYSEPLDIISKTCEAAQRAALPAGCRVSFFGGVCLCLFWRSRESVEREKSLTKNSLFFLFFPLLPTSINNPTHPPTPSHQVTVYLCDDGKDPKKRRWCMAPGRGVVYVSGRTRASGEMNGKSANLNNCAKQIYPEGQPIPPNEIICVFDADQVANPDFFLKMLYKFDAGEDVAMVLSPQVSMEVFSLSFFFFLFLLLCYFSLALCTFAFASLSSFHRCQTSLTNRIEKPSKKTFLKNQKQSFYNTNLRADIFNHSNTHFWEYAQHGYDALGFISCTGTNFLIRSAAFRDAG